MGIIEKIKEIEAEMARTQKNKATGIVFNFLLCVCVVFITLMFDCCIHNML